MLDGTLTENGLTYDQLTETIRSLPVPAGAHEVQKNLELIRDLGANIQPILREIVDSRTLLSSIASRSYRHVNHFDKVLLVEADNDQGYRLTMHVWNPPYSEEEHLDELIHDHRFSFWSTIIAGTLVSQEFVPDADGPLYQNYQYSPEDRSARNFYKFCGRGGLSPSRRITELRGGSYYLSYDTTHCVILPRQSMTCTLVLRSPRARNFSNVYNTSYPDTDTSCANVPFSSEGMKARLERVLAAAVGVEA